MQRIRIEDYKNNRTHINAIYVVSLRQGSADFWNRDLGRVVFIVKDSQCVMHVRQGIVIEYRNVTDVHAFFRCG